MSRAVERAHTLGGYKPHWQLQPPLLPLPPSLQPMLRLLECPELYRLAWAILQVRALTDFFVL